MTALGKHTRRWTCSDPVEGRDWAEWDAEHPYIPVGDKSGAGHTFPTSSGSGTVWVGGHGVASIKDPDLQVRVKALQEGDNPLGHIDLHGVHPDAQEGCVRSLEAFHGQYPDIKVDVQTKPELNIGGIFGDQTAYASCRDMAAAGARGESTITLNAQYFGDPAVMTKSYADCVNSGFHCAGTGTATSEDIKDPKYGAHVTDSGNMVTPESFQSGVTIATAQAITDHELGHALGNAVGGEITESDAINRAMDSLKESGAHAGLYGSSVLSYPDKINAAMEAVSDYSKSSAREFVAEARAQSLGTKPTPESTAIMNEMNKAYAR